MHAPKSSILSLAAALGSFAAAWQTEPALAQTTEAAAVEAMDFDIPAMPLAEALRAFSVTSRVAVAASGDQVANRRSAAVRGRYSPEAALRLMLTDTGLEARQSSARSFALIEMTATTRPIQADTIVVTATKTEIDILDAPAAVAVVSAEKIAAQGAQTAVEALQGEPSIRVSYYTEGNFPIVQIRGAGDIGQFQNTDVLVLIDGIPQVNLNDQSIYDQIPFEAVDRIEVVRGPTSALYGRNGVGGTINILTRNAPEEFEASGSIIGGSFGFVKPRLTLGGAVSENINVLISGSYESVDGWRDGTEREAIDFFAKADIAITPRTNLTLSAQYFDLEQGVVSLLPLLPDGGNVPGIDVTENFNIPGAESRNDSLQLAAVFDHAFSDVLQFTAPVYYRETNRILDRDGSFIDNINTETQTFDLFPFSPVTDESIFGVRPQLTWTPSPRIEIIAGGDYERNDANSGASVTVPDGGGPFDPITVNYATGAFSADLNTLDTIVRRDGEFKSTIWALYAQARLGITDRLRLTLGGRYDRQDRTLADDLRPNPFVEADYDRFTPRVALDYAFTENLRGYASYSQGFNPPFGGAFAFERAGADELEPEVATNYEVGFKTRLPDGRGYANIAAFFLEREDLVQVLRIEGINTQVNAGGLDIWGVEFDAGYDLGAGFTISGNYSYTDTEWQEFTVRDVSFAGFEVIQTPNHLASASLDWASADNRFEIGAFVDYVGARFADRPNTVELDAYTLVNFQAAFRPWKDDRLTFRVQGFNLLDEEFLTRTELDFLGNVLGGSPGRPASVLASINIRY